MFGSLRMPEIIVILVIALIIFGPRKLPELGRSLGRGIAEFKKATTDFQHSLEQDIDARGGAGSLMTATGLASVSTSSSCHVTRIPRLRWPVADDPLVSEDITWE